MNDSPVSLATESRSTTSARGRSVLPWAVAAIAALAAVILAGILLFNESSQTRPVAQLTAQGQPDPDSISADDEGLVEVGLTAADFVSYGSYGELEIWGTSELDANGFRCLAVIAEGHISMHRCAPPTLDTILDFWADANDVPPAPSGEQAGYFRLILHENAIDVYLAPNADGGFY